MLDRMRQSMAALFGTPQVDREMDEELRSHIQHRADDLERAGMNRAEAERRAKIEFGGYERVKAECHESLAGHLTRTLLQDVRFGLRMLRKTPGFTAIAVLTLAAGIGANAIVFSLLDALVLRPVNLPGAANLYMIQQGHSPSNSYPDYVDLRDRNRTFQGIALCAMAPAGLSVNGDPVPVWLYEASGNYFDVLGVQPYLGRFFHAADERGPNSAPYIVLSYGYWQSHFHGDRGIVGRAAQINKHAYTIVGVAPPAFRGTELFLAPDLWAPSVNEPQIEGTDDLTARGARGAWVVGRLKPGVTPAQATEDLNSVAAWMRRAYPADDEGVEFTLARPGLLGDMLSGPVHAFVAGLMLLAGLILLAACTNLGSLFAARTADRAREVAVRLAVGSSRGRILRQLLTEAAMVSLAGGAVGIALCIPVLRWLSSWQPAPNFPVNLPVSPDWRTYAVALLLAGLSAVIFGLVPVRQVFKADPYQGIKAGSAGTVIGRRITVRDVLLGVQVTVCAVLVTASLVAVRGMVRSLHSNFGFVPEGAVQVNTDLSMGGYRGDQAAAMQRQMLERIENIPGVTAAGFANRVPLDLGWSDTSIWPDSATEYKPSNSVASAMEYRVSPGYFHAAETALRAGRDFTWRDGKDAPRVALVNEEFARKIFGSESKALGGFFKIWGGTRVQVVGVVEDGKYKTLSEDPQPAVFMSILQSPSTWIWFVARSNRGTAELAGSLERTLGGMNTGLPFGINTWNRELDTALFAARAASLALGALGAMGALLAVTGIFGMAAYSVSKRLRELGIRIALGAQRKAVLMAALGRVLRLLAVGSVAGLLLGIAATKLLSYIVYQATPRDPLVLVSAILSMALLGLLAAWIPARRALAADPLALLREE